MKMSELSRRSGVAIPTIKYYLREGLLPAGHATASNQADYDADHLRRLRLVRALISFGGLSVTASREVLRAISEPLDLYHTLGVTHYALGAPVADTGASAGTGGPDAPGEADDCAAEAAALVDRMGWSVGEESPGRAALAAGLRALRRVGADVGTDELLPYAELAAATARVDLDHLAGIEDRIDVAERALVMTVLLEPVLATLRRMAQEHEAALRYPSESQQPPRPPATRAGADTDTADRGARTGSHRAT
ncbi:MerR family transcriptional regulator [Streptomyces sp. AC563]|nr:MerR family transcriptional regulator [Streptomyces buecherae]